MNNDDIVFHILRESFNLWSSSQQK